MPVVVNVAYNAQTESIKTSQTTELVSLLSVNRIVINKLCEQISDTRKHKTAYLNFGQQIPLIKFLYSCSMSFPPEVKSQPLYIHFGAQANDLQHHFCSLNAAFRRCFVLFVVKTKTSSSFCDILDV